MWKFSWANFWWLSPFLAFILGYQVMQLFSPYRPIATPNLIGKSLAEAIQIATDLNLNLRQLSTRVDHDLPPQTVISQTPNCSTIKPNQTIFIVISKGPESQTVPNLLGLQLEQAQKECREKGVAADFHPITGNGPHSHCLAQQPSPGGCLTNKMVVYYTTSHDQHILVPRLVGQPIQEVQTFLVSNGIQSIITHWNNPFHNPGLVEKGYSNG